MLEQHSKYVDRAPSPTPLWSPELEVGSDAPLRLALTIAQGIEQVNRISGLIEVRASRSELPVVGVPHDSRVVLVGGVEETWLAVVLEGLLSEEPHESLSRVGIFRAKSHEGEVP